VGDDGKRDDQEAEIDQRRLRDARRQWHLVDQLLHRGPAIPRKGWSAVKRDHPLSASQDRCPYLRGQIEEVERAARRMIDELSAELLDSYWDFLES